MTGRPGVACSNSGSRSSGRVVAGGESGCHNEADSYGEPGEDVRRGGQAAREL
jgi:hypothetical protein